MNPLITYDIRVNVCMCECMCEFSHPPVFSIYFCVCARRTNLSVL